MISSLFMKKNGKYIIELSREEYENLKKMEEKQREFFHSLEFVFLLWRNWFDMTHKWKKREDDLDVS